MVQSDYVSLEHIDNRKGVTAMPQMYPLYEEVKPLFEKYCLTREIELRNQLVQMHDGLVRIIAAKFAGFNSELWRDLCQEGRIGLIIAVEKFEPSRGYHFDTYARPRIEGYIFHYLRDKKKGIKVARVLQELNGRVVKVSNQLAQTLGREPSIAEIALKLGLKAETVATVIETDKNTDALSLDWQIVGEDGFVIYSDIVGINDRGIESIGQFDDLKDALLSLNEQEQTVINHKFFDGLTQAQIAEKLCISNQRIGRIVQRALKKLKHILSFKNQPS